MQQQTLSKAGYILAALGILGVIISLVTMQSDYDPVAFGIASVSILLAVLGISLAFRVSRDEQTSPKG